MALNSPALGGFCWRPSGQPVYQGAAVYFWAVVNEARDRGACPHLDPKWVKTTVRVERGLTKEVQIEPLTVPVLRSRS